MAVVYAFLADGLEEVECLATADVLIRAGVKVKLVSITGKKEVKGAHGFGIHADTLLHEIDPMKADLLFLPGGMPGTKNLMACRPLCDALVQADAAGKRLAAICAAPMVLAGSTFKMADTGPMMPRRRRAPAARMTALTEFW